MDHLDEEDEDRLRFVIVDSPLEPEIDQCILLGQRDQEIILTPQMAQDLAIDIMRAFGLSWWPEPQDDQP